MKLNMYMKHLSVPDKAETMSIMITYLKFTSQD